MCASESILYEIMREECMFCKIRLQEKHFEFSRMSIENGQ